MMKNRISIETAKVRFETAPELYGLFFEDINRAADGGLYPECIRNRSFEDSILPEGCTADENRVILMNDGKWPGPFNHGEGMDEWAAAVPYTEVPAWYAAKASMEIVKKDTLNPHRVNALKVHFEEGGCIENIGFSGISAKEGESYAILFFAKCDKALTLTWALEGEDGRTLGSAEFTPEPGAGYVKYTGRITAEGTDHKSRLVISADREAEVLFGFTSLLPEKTFKGHGLREDLALALKNTYGKFLRFPGGCVVEGLNAENTPRFSTTVGPIWERPSVANVWHCRATNGLGLHEYLQLCEDLEMEALYVCNCGMSCQARNGHAFTDEVTEEHLQEALWALEYALGDENTRWGRLRAEMGHPAPFKLKYVEIGNENNGPDYLKRYLMFYEALKKAYPEVIYISNCHTERDGLPTEFVDEHYYSAPEFFLENEDLFDDYDRKGPKIFLGEYAVNGGKTVASMECGLAEAVFLMGMERNQDIVRLSAYAPLFQNVDYTCWKPNLIVFDNHQVYGIPSYHVISLLGKYRGNEVVEMTISGPQEPPKYTGISGIRADSEGILFKNAKVNGQPVDISRVIYGTVEEKDGETKLLFGGEPHKYIGKSKEWNEAFTEYRKDSSMFGDKPFAWISLGNEDMEEYSFSVDVKAEKDASFTLSIWNYKPNTDAGCNEPKDPEWTPMVRSQKWRLENGISTVRVPFFRSKPLSDDEKVPYDIDFDTYHTYEIRAEHGSYSCLIDGKFIQKNVLPEHRMVSGVATADSEYVYVKLANTSAFPQEAELSLDCDVEADYTAETVSADPAEVNSFEKPENVSAELKELTGASRSFNYTLPPYSVQVLKLRKKV